MYNINCLLYTSTEGAFKVSASRKQGKTQFIHIKSLAGEPCIVTTDIVNPIFEGKRNFTIQSFPNNTFQIAVSYTHLSARNSYWTTLTLLR